MTSGPVLQWTLTGVFAVCAALYIAQVLLVDAWQLRVARSLHGLMALAMIAMSWPWGLRYSPIAEVLVFTAGALYFAYLGLFATGVDHSDYHAVMMGAMALMALVMSTTTMPSATDRGAVRAMPGMDMAGGVSPTASATTPGWVIIACGVAAVFFLGATLPCFYVLVRGPQRPFADLLMTAGMGVAFAALVI